MALPNFLIVGAMKAGTTSLSDALSRHPDVFIPAAKEPNSLLAETVLTDGRRAYEDMFALGRSASARGEASTAYTKRYMGGEASAAHAHALLGNDLRLIYLVRDPLARAASHARHSETAARTFDREQPIKPTDPEAEVGYYAHQIAPWLERFGADSLLVLDMAELINDWPTASAAVCTHLGIDPELSPPTLEQANASDDARPAKGLMANVLSSGLYRSLQDRIPLTARRRLRSLLVRRAPASTISKDTLLVEDETLHRWRAELDALHEMTGVRCASPHLDRRLDG